MTHKHGPTTYRRAFAMGVALNLAFVAIEIVFGLLAHSVALISDAGHNLSDALGLLLAWGASALARRRPSQRRTYGLRSSSILAALVNAVILLVVTGGVIWESVRRLNQPVHVAGETVIWVALAGVGVNGVTALLFLSGRKGDLNVRGAFTHMAADAGLSLGVALAGVIILATHWQWLDPTVSLVISVVILVGTWSLLRESVNLALDAVPEGVDVEGISDYLDSLPGVASVHDLHIWGMSTTETALTAHLVIPKHPGSDAFLAATRRELHERFDIEHATLQIEEGDPAHPCGLGSDDSI